MTLHSSTSITSALSKILCSCLILVVAFSHSITAQTLTWSDDIACIVFNACTPCHHKSGVAPFALTSYAEVYERRFQIQEAVLAERMPPWMPDPHHQRFIDERHLDDADIKAIDDWVLSGAMAGNLDEQPELPLLDLKTQIANPDLTLRVPKYVVPDLPDIDLYRCFVFDHNLVASRFISEIEILPSDPSLVHHVILYQDPSGTSTTLDHNDPNPGYVCFGGIGSNEASMIAGWAPGAGPIKMPPGFGVKLDPNSKLVIQVHYPAGNAGKVDDTKINLKFVEQGVPSREIFIAPILNHITSMLNGPLTIRAGQRKTFNQLFINPFKLTVTGIAPHAHLVCESMKAFGVTPGGDTIDFINIPHWDFEWQGYYQFQKPIIVPAGTAIYGEAS